MPHATVVRVDGPRQWLRFRREETTAADLIAALATRYELRDLTIEEPEIEAIIRDLYSAGQPPPSPRPPRSTVSPRIGRRGCVVKIA